MSERRRSMLRFYQSVAEEGRTRSIKPFAEAVAVPLPPQVTPSVLARLGVWPPPQSSRDMVVRNLERTLVGPSHYSSRYGAVPEPEAKRVAAALEAGAFAFTKEYTAGVTLASDLERFVVLQAYCKAHAFRLFEFYESRAPPPAASGDVRDPGNSSAEGTNPATSE